MKTTEQGRIAEAAVASHLEGLSFKILALNWRRPRCEIDIVAKKDKIIYLIEVKYRAGFAQGEGLEYITPKKLKQMHFAADIWVSENGWSGDIRLMAASVSGIKAEEIELVEV